MQATFRVLQQRKDLPILLGGRRPLHTGLIRGGAVALSLGVAAGLVGTYFSNPILACFLFVGFVVGTGAALLLATAVGRLRRHRDAQQRQALLQEAPGYLHGSALQQACKLSENDTKKTLRLLCDEGALQFRPAFAAYKVLDVTQLQAILQRSAGLRPAARADVRACLMAQSSAAPIANTLVFLRQRQAELDSLGQPTSQQCDQLANVTKEIAQHEGMLRAVYLGQEG